MSNNKARMARSLPTGGTQPIPRIGDLYAIQRPSQTRILEVTTTEWDDERQELTVTMKPVITEELAMASDPVVVQDTNPYKSNVVVYDANSHKQYPDDPFGED